MAALPNPLRRGSWGWGMLDQQNHAAGGGNGSIMVGMFVCLCLASQKPSERDLFVPARMDLDVKLLSCTVVVPIYSWCMLPTLTQGDGHSQNAK
jgi:hypothetical protein